MKKISIYFISILLTSNLMSQEIKTYEQQISYIIGYNIGRNLKQEAFAFDYQAVAMGVKTAFDQSKPLFTDQQIGEMMQEWQQKMEAAQQNQMAETAGEAKAQGKAFLEENKKDKEVKVTASGLQYKVVTEGTGAKPTSATDKVRVHYEGKLLDGTIFDSSYERGEPISFALNQVIPGWTEGVQLMSIGSKYIFYIPSDLAYGDRSVSVIPGGSTLIFTVELLGINE